MEKSVNDSNQRYHEAYTRLNIIIRINEKSGDEQKLRVHIEIVQSHSVS